MAATELRKWMFDNGPRADPPVPGRNGSVNRLADAGQLAAGVAHDITNAVTVIKLYADLLVDNPGIDPAALEHLRAIQSEADRASSLAWQVLDVAHRMPPALTRVDLVGFVDEFARVARRLLPASVEVRHEHNGREAAVFADPDRLHQVLMNLTGNARQALREQGEMVFRTGQVCVGRSRAAPVRGMIPGDWARVDVVDNGVGIPADVLPRVFEPFFSTKVPGQGTGLGLSQVRSLIEEHDGHVQIASRPGEGTTVTVWLPAAGDATAGHSEPPPVENGSGERVLVVEPDPALRDALVRVVETLGYQVVVARDGEQALEALDHVRDVRVVVSAMTMAGLGGEGLARVLAQRRPDVVVILAGQNPVAADDPHSGGPDPPVLRLRKPFSTRQIGSALRVALARA